MLPQEGPQFFSQHKLHFESFFTIHKEQRNTFFFQVWVIAFDLLSTAFKEPVLPDSPIAQATPWAVPCRVWEAAPALSLSHQDWRGCDRISGGGNNSSSSSSNSTVIH